MVAKRALSSEVQQKGLDRDSGGTITSTGRSSTRKVSPWLYASPHALVAMHQEKEGSAVEAFGKWVAGLANWSWFVTRTLADKNLTTAFTAPGLGTARRCLRDLLVWSQCQQFVCVFELQRRGVPHLHALLGASKGIRGDQAQSRDAGLWGFSKWVVYREGGGAAAYLGKYLGKEIVELYVGLDGPYSQRRLKGTTLGGLRV